VRTRQMTASTGTALLCVMSLLSLYALSIGGSALAQDLSESIAESASVASHGEVGAESGAAENSAAASEPGAGHAQSDLGAIVVGTTAPVSVTAEPVSEIPLSVPVIAPVATPIEVLAGVPDEVVVVLNTSISTVIAHIQTGKGNGEAVSLIADLAVADTKLGAAAAEASKLRQIDARFDALEKKVARAGFKSIEEYLVIRQSGILTDAEMALIDPLIKAVGGTKPNGVSLVRTRPEDADIERAREFLADARGDVARAERAIAKALEKDASLKAVLAAVRGKLAPYRSKIAAAVD
jgi:hypothetical protein